jgi:hypothetical protein
MYSLKVCECGNESFESLNIIKTMMPPLHGFKCTECEKEQWVSSIPEVKEQKIFKVNKED